MALNAYEGVEHADNFADSAAVDLYRRAALDKSRAQADFIVRNFSQAGRLLEACCGNGRLLMALAPHLDQGYGFDLAQSRIDFGTRWIADQAMANLEIWRDDILSPSPRLSGLRVDLAVCITGAFGYFEPLEDGAGRQVIEDLAGCIEPGGGLLLELHQHPREAAACCQAESRILRSWIELPESDPFRFYLSEYSLDEPRHLLTHNKTFIGRDGAIDDGRSEALRLYSLDEIAALLEPWFEKLSFYSDWMEMAYGDGDEILIVTARRKG
jgi:SAM-dependent methyltransferase